MTRSWDHVSARSRVQHPRHPADKDRIRTEKVNSAVNGAEGVEDDMKEEELQETVIEVDDDGDDDDDDGDEEEECAGHASTSGQILYSVTLPDSACRLRVVHGDLTKQRVDCIVNAANVGLQHTGGLAAAVRKAGL